MNEEHSTQRTAIDQIADGDGLQMYKAAVPYLPVQMQKYFSLFIKFQEMQNLLSFFQAPVHASSVNSEMPTNPEDILEELCSYGNAEQKAAIEQALSLMNTLKMYQNYKDLI